jgi:queuine tRNA-ribosyltransferase
VTLDCEVVVTRSGARAIRDRITGEVMHPVVGPLVEAERLYVGPSRLAQRLSPPQGEGDGSVCVLDVGLGAASNAIAAWRVSESTVHPARRLRIVSFDSSLAALEVAISSENPADFGFDDAAVGAARGLLQNGLHETERTSWRLVLGELPRTLEGVAPASADIVFWDPFSPQANPELWSYAAFVALSRACREGATVHTYSGATAVRSAMLLAGFAVGLGEPIGPGKQSTCAALDPRDLASPLSSRWLERLRRSSAAFPPDAPSDALARVEGMAQFVATSRETPP